MANTDQRKRLNPDVLIALIGALASMGVAVITASCQARPAAASALEQKVGETQSLQSEIASLKAQAADLRDVQAGLIPLILTIAETKSTGGRYNFPRSFRHPPVVVITEEAPGDWVLFKVDKVDEKGFSWAARSVVGELTNYGTELAWIAATRTAP